MQDAKIVENACLALSRIAESLSHSPEHVDTLCKSGLVTSALQLIAVSTAGSMSSQLSVSTYYGLVKLLTTCVISSPAVAETLLQNGISGILSSLLRRWAVMQCAAPVVDIVNPSAYVQHSDRVPARRLCSILMPACSLLWPQLGSMP